MMDDIKKSEHEENTMRNFSRLLDRWTGQLDSMTSREPEDKEREMERKMAALALEASLYAAKMQEIDSRQQEIKRKLLENTLKMREDSLKLYMNLVNENLDYIAQVTSELWPDNPTYAEIVVELYEQFKRGEQGFVELIKKLIEGFDKEMAVEEIHDDGEIIRQGLHSADNRRWAYYYELAKKGADSINLDEIAANLENSWPTSVDHRKKVLKLFKQFKNGRVTQSSLLTKLLNALDKEFRRELESLASQTAMEQESTTGDLQR